MNQILPATDTNIQTAALEIKSGNLVAFPTETVYGLGADATNDVAVASIFAAKMRPDFNPLISHIPDFKTAMQYALHNSWAEVLAQVFWPGPLTFILKRRPDCAISKLASAGLDTLALRAPEHPTAQKFLQACKTPIAAPSANKSGSLSPTTPQHVLHSLGENVPTILADGMSKVGLESTVIDLSGDTPCLLRHGAITQEEIEELIGPISVSCHTEGNEAPKSPGQLLKHYAPNTPLRLNAVDLSNDEALLGFGNLKFMGVSGGGFAADLPQDQTLNLSPTGDLNEAAGNLFAMLHKLDLLEFKSIAVMNIPNTGLGIAINDRLIRAAKA
ncbi:MAG: threonylcarbamoyl-AMP synthase [Gammaproteobacteria bacterium]|nr:threonylcarbamoyl-AMP synthase [Gammaproteobacteria bacterium]